MTVAVRWGLALALGSGACRPEPVALHTGGDPTGGAEPHSGLGPSPTWREVGPILEARCVACHREGEVAPMALDTWERAAPWAARLAQVARDRVMPPYLVDPTGACQEFQDPGWLTGAELAALEGWAAADAPSGGDPSPLAAPPADHLDPPDAVLDLGLAFTPTEPPDQYRCFLADPGLDRDRFMTAYEVVPGEPSMVHHVSLFTVDSEEAEARARALDAADPVPGYDCFGGAMVGPDSRQVAGWAVGTPTTRLPDGTGLRLHAGRPVVISMHYHTEAEPLADRTQVRLALRDQVRDEAYVLRPFDATMVLEPGRAELEHAFETDLEALTGRPGLGAVVHGVFPHLHERGRSIRLERVSADGSTECLADVPRWDFTWQRTYFYRAPVAVGPTDRLRLTCTFDTSGDEVPVRFGESTDDEMCVVGMLATAAPAPQGLER